MAFKSMKQYNEERYGGLFRLVNDGDSADVIFLYTSVNDVLVGDMHYIKSAEYSGYVHCAGRGCPVCGKGIRVQSKLFVPMYNLTDNEIQFWDRSIKFENQLNSDVFSKFPNPSEYVFRITRHGVPNDINTTYEIRVVGKNSQESYDQILNRFGVKMPDHYDTICKEFDVAKLSDLLAKPDNGDYSEDLPDYSVTPRAAATSAPAAPAADPMIPNVYESVPQDTMIPETEFAKEDADDDVDDVSF